MRNGPHEKIEVRHVLEVAYNSQCSRRKYGAVITWEGYNTWLSSGWNERVGTCCNGICVRDRLELGHGVNTDAGGEIHAEQAALINLSHKFGDRDIYVAGMNNMGPLNGFDNSPCYSCARMIKFAGIKNVYLPIDGEWERFDIADIMETWEAKWE